MYTYFYLSIHAIVIDFFFNPLFFKHPFLSLTVSDRLTRARNTEAYPDSNFFYGSSRMRNVVADKQIKLSTSSSRTAISISLLRANEETESVRKQTNGNLHCSYLMTRNFVPYFC